MKMLYLLAGVAALALASAAYAQAQKDPKATETNSSSQQPYGTSDPAAASSPAQRDSTSVKAPETSTGGSPEASSASSPHQQDAVSLKDESDASASAKPAKEMTGMKVETPAGESIGEVKNVLYDKDGRATYAVISYGGKMGMGTKHTAVPWATVSPMIKGDKLLIDRSLLEQAPLISSAKPDPSNSKWSHEADSYWRGKVTLAPATVQPAPEGT